MSSGGNENGAGAGIISRLPEAILTLFGDRDLATTMAWTFTIAVFACTLIFIGVGVGPFPGANSAEAFRGMVFKGPLKEGTRILPKSFAFAMEQDELDAQDDDPSGSPLWDEPDEHAAPPPAVTHFCFLAHGHRGFSRDLKYMQVVMQRLSTLERKRQWEDQQGGAQSRYNSKCESDLSQDSFDESAFSKKRDATRSRASSTSTCDRTSQYRRQDIVIHAAVCNEHKTVDGVRSGGERLAEEMKEVIRNSMAKWPTPVDGSLRDVTISFVGNSLGGLYSRYALSKFIQECTEDGNSWIFDGKFRVHLNIFCTTATPHLGVSQHTYVPLPRTAEIGVARAMGDTGKDLFRVNSLIKTMSTSPVFLRPLARFRKRIAYANAYGTDFPVPAGTAAFLSPLSTYPHHFVEMIEREVVSDSKGDQDESDVVAAALSNTEPDEGLDADESGNDDSDDAAVKKLIIAMLHTPRHESALDDLNSADVGMTVEECADSSSEETPKSQLKDDLHDMSTSLDRLGWKKVFVDMRDEIPSMEIPRSLMPRRSDSDLTVDDNIHALKRKGIVQSKDIAMAVAAQPGNNRVSIPLGHNMIVAFSRSRISAQMNKGGRPVVDALAKELVEDIFSWPSTDEDR